MDGHVVKEMVTGARKGSDLTLKDVLEVGGTKEDLQLLQGIEEKSIEVFDGKKHDFEAEPIKQDDIREFIGQLGLIENRPKSDDGSSDGEDTKKKKKKKKKVKLAVMEGEEFEEHADTDGTSPVNKKAKSKNKFQVQDSGINSSTPPVRSDSKDSATHPALDYKQRKSLLVKLSGKWFEVEFPNDPKEFEDSSDDLVQRLRDYTARVLLDDVTLYNKQKDKSRADNSWLKTVRASGTLSDKMAAMTLQIQEGPVHSLETVDVLLTMANKKGRRECLMALDTLKDLFLSDLLPDNRKLKTFDQHPLVELDSITSGNRDSRDKRLVMWYYEDQLKDKYNSFIKALEKVSHDTIQISKKKALSIMYEMLIQKPEQEKVLLSHISNKLGDPDPKIASKAAHLLARLVDHHPNMKSVVVLELERLIYRPNVSSKAQYYGMCFLNKLLLSHDEAELAARLIGIYFSFFKVFVKKGELDTKMMSVLLTGVNRAYPYAKVDQNKISEHMNTLYKVVHVVTFNISVQALMLLYQVMDSNDGVSDRYYVALYRKLFDPELKTSSKQTMFLNLLFKSMKKDASERRAKAFVKRLLQVCAYQGASFTCAALVLLSEVLRVKTGILQTKHVSEDLDEDEHFVDIKPESDDTGSDSDDNRDPPPQKRAPSWVHRKNLMDKSDTAMYEPNHRNPLYCKADKECELELEKLANHFHPSVALFAQNILKGEYVHYTGDPLRDFTLIRFLDRFVYRNPKKKNVSEAGSGMLHLEKRNYEVKGIRAIPVNSEEYLKNGEQSIPVEEKFFYRYFKEKSAKEDKHKEDDASEGSISDSEFDQYLDYFEPQMVGDREIKFDFAGEFDKKSSKKKKKSDKEDADDGSDDGDDESDDLSGEEIDFGDDFAKEFAEGEYENDVEFDDEFTEGKADNWEESAAFSDDELDEANFSEQSNRKRKSSKDSLPGKRSRSKSDLDGSSLFAAAEEFADVIDENAGSNVDSTTMNAFAVKDKADLKQLKWEQKRLSGNDWRAKKKGHNIRKFGKPNKSNRGKKR